jgi:hypothetical protein
MKIPPPKLCENNIKNFNEARRRCQELAPIPGTPYLIPGYSGDSILISLMLHLK